ncbi:MAG: acyl-CoA dehydrogenase family protein, partial [Verrucomicrobiota bacterium]
MDFSWTPEQESLREKTLAFAGEKLNRDAGSDFSRDLWKQCADFGILRSFMPAAYGGDDLDIVSTILMMEAVGEGCRDNGFTLALNGQMWSIQEPILRFGSEEQKQTYLPGLGDGSLIGSHGMTEAETGSDAFSLKTTAVRQDDGGYLLNGRKSFIGLAPVCDLALVFANTEPAMGKWGVSVFLVEKGTPGFTLSAPREKMGLNSNPLGDLIFEDCPVPEEQRLGKEGVGVSLFKTSMDWERSFIFASHVGSMARQLDDCVNFANERNLFDQSIGKFQSVSNRIADMKLRLETSRLLLYKLAWMKEHDRNAVMEAALANLHLAESFAASSVDAMRIHGARGYVSEYGVEQDVRDALGGVIYSGTSDIQRNIIANMLGL